MSEVEEYERLPVRVKMLLWDEGNLNQMLLFTEGRFRQRSEWTLGPGRGMTSTVIVEVYDFLHDTWVRVNPGDRVVAGIEGEFYPIAPGPLAKTYRKVS